MRIFLDRTLQTQSKSRKRAPQACLSCRNRKVRCDVALRGRPCMNCSLDNEPCVVPERATRRKRSILASSDAPRTPMVHGDLEEKPADAMDSVERVVLSDLESCLVPPAPFMEEAPTLTQGNDLSSQESGSPRQSSPMCLLPTTLHDGGHSHSSDASDILYTFYPFLGIDRLSNLPPEDVNFLEHQGSLRIPVRALLEEFMRQYFMHVHPLLPLIEEDEFWELYSVEPDDLNPSKPIPLLVLQAMLFASCNLVSRSTIEALGYDSIRAAKSSFYRRAKLLYDLDTESSHLALAQTALLLSFGTVSTNRDQTTWLSLAIQHAKAAGAHCYASSTILSSHQNPKKHREQTFLKKLWWCCVIRDRTLALLLKRPIQISRDHFDIDSSPPLELTDLQHEFENSKVYNSEVKKTLAGILVKLVELHVVLTDVLQIIPPLDDFLVLNNLPVPNEGGCVGKCKQSLNDWYQSTILQFPSLQKSHGVQSISESTHSQVDSITLHTNLMCMYYHSSCVIVSHYEILHLTVPRPPPNYGGPDSISSNKTLSTIHESRQALQRAVSGVTDCLKELACFDLVRWLPISAVACTALPLLLHILDINLSSTIREGKGKSKDKSSIKQHQLNILIAAMRAYQPQYEGVDWVIKIVRHVIGLARLDNPTFSGTGECIIDWADILSLQPSFYLSLVLALDVGLSKGRLPQEGDFPLGLRDLFMDGFNPLKRLVEAHRVVKSPQDFSHNSVVSIEFCPSLFDGNSSSDMMYSPQLKPKVVSENDGDKNSTPPEEIGFGEEMTISNEGVEEENPSAVTNVRPSELVRGVWEGMNGIEILARCVYRE